MKVMHGCFVGSVGLHLAFWLGLPNPLPPTKTSARLQIVSLTRVVEIPRQPQSIGAAPTTPLGNTPPSDLLASAPPVTDGLTVPPLDLSAKIPAPPTDLPTDISFEKLPVVSPPITKPPKEQPTALPPPPEETPPPEISPEIPEPSPKLSVPLPSPSPQAAATLTGNGRAIGLGPEDYTREFVSLYTELSTRCGATNVIRSRIPTPGKDLVSQINEEIESGVAWVPPTHFPEEELLQDLEIVVRATLVVEEDGRVSQRRFLSSDLEIIDGIVSQTLDGYDDKFPSLPGKCRLVTVNYYFPDKSGK